MLVVGLCGKDRNWWDKLKVVLKNATKQCNWAQEFTRLESADHRRLRDLESMARVPQATLVNREGRNPLQNAAQAGQAYELARIVEGGLYDINAKTPRQWTALMLACENGHIKAVRYLLEQRLKINMQNKKSRTTLHIAAYEGHADVVRALVRRSPGPADIHVKDRQKRTAFRTAAQRGKADVVRILHRSGADVNQLSAHGWTALHLAAEEDKLETVEYLLAKGADQSIRIKKGSKAGKTAKEGRIREGEESFPLLMGLDHWYLVSTIAGYYLYVVPLGDLSAKHIANTSPDRRTLLMLTTAHTCRCHPLTGHGRNRRLNTLHVLRSLKSTSPAAAHQSHTYTSPRRPHRHYPYNSIYRRRSPNARS